MFIIDNNIIRRKKISKLDNTFFYEYILYHKL